MIEPKINMVTMQTDSLNKITIERKSDELNSIVQTAQSIYPKVKIIPYLLGDSVISSLLAYAEKEHFDLIVMGTKGAGRIKEVFMGTITSGAIEKTKIPLLSVPLFSELRKPQTILLAIDQFEKGKDLFYELMELAKLFSANLKIVLIKDNEEKRALVTLEHNLKEFKEFMIRSFPAISIQAELVEGVDFEESIATYCSLHNVDLIAMVSYPKSFWEKLFRKGNTKEMAIHSSIPILAIPKSNNSI